MHCRTRHDSSFSHRRAALAPLELVLNLPLLLLVMALILIFGTAGSWKLRTVVTSRHAAWRSFAARAGATDPRPAGWPETAKLTVRSAGPPLFDADPFADFAVVRGPVLAVPETGESLPVHDNTLDVTLGLIEGNAELERAFPLLSKMPPHKVHFKRDHQVLDGSRWQFWNMGLPTNESRRIPSLYPFDLSQHVPELTAQYDRVARETYDTWRQPSLGPLDHDDELIPWGFPKDFHPPRQKDHGEPHAPERICTFNPEEFVREFLRPLIDQIRGKPEPNAVAGVPEKLTKQFIGLYRYQLQLQENGKPPPKGAMFQTHLNEKIDSLTDFLQTLP